MKSTYVDAVTGERHILVRIASDATALMTARQDQQQDLLLLVLRNQQLIMQRLEDGAKPAVRDELQKQRQQTEARLAQPAPAHKEAA